MTTHQYKFMVWCEKAVSGILFPPDQNRVYRELMDHMCDHYDDLIGQGCDPETAAQLVVTSMGDAERIAPQLAAIHRPFWGYFLRVTRIALAVLACVLVVSGCIRLWHTDYHDFSEYRNVNPYRDTGIDLEDSTYRRIFFAEPDLSVQSDGYTITLARAALWHADHDDPAEEDGLNFYFQMEVFNPLPWAQNTDISRWFRAVDSLGNTYDCCNESVVNLAPYIAGNSYHTGPLTYTHDMWISDYRSRDAEWIEFYYDRAGRHLSFRLDLTGGGEA